MHRGTVAHLITLATVLLTQSAGRLVIVPVNTETNVNDTTYLNCSTNLTSKEIFWEHGDKYIYTGNNIILEPYYGRFEIDRNASKGSHNLVILSVKLGDAGTYICIDDDGHGTRRSAELVVLESDPSCQSNIQSDGVIGQNPFNIPPDEVQLRCSASYHGNIPPKMEWRKVGDDNAVVDDVKTISSNNLLTHTLNLRGDVSLDGSSYVCQTTRTKQKQYKCNSENIDVLYLIDGNWTEQSIFRGDEITCFVDNNTFTCTRQWYHGNYTCPLSCDENITTHLLGEYVCKVTCHIRGEDFDMKPLKAIVVEPTVTAPPTNWVLIVVPIVSFGVAVIAVLVAVYYFWKNKRKGAVLVISPRDTEATVNDSTYMNCSTSLSKSVQWHHGSYYVYTGEGILEPYNGRFAIEVRTRPHAYNLVIHSVQPQDAGEYECKDDEGFGESRSAHLIVIDDDPVCTSNIQPDGVVGSNSCGVEPDEVILSCSVTYYGNTPPIIEWRQLNGGSNQPVTQKVNTSTSANNLISTLTVNAGVDSSLNNSSFICQTTRDVGKHHSCSTGGIKILRTRCDALSHSKRDVKVVE